MPATKKNIKKSTTARASGEMRSFRAYPAEKPFFQARINHQTFYWLVICLLVLALGIWALLLTIKIQAIYDRVDAITTTGNAL